MDAPAFQPSPQEQQILSQFADIILPEQIGWWPFSLQLWAALVAFILCCCAILYLVIHAQKKQRYKKLSLKKLSNIQTNLDDVPVNLGYQKINELLKSALLAGGEPRQKLATLHGEAWYNYLLSCMPLQKQEKVKHHQSIFRHWSEEAYGANQSNINHLTEFVDFAKHVIRFHRPNQESSDA